MKCFTTVYYNSSDYFVVVLTVLPQFVLVKPRSTNVDTNSKNMTNSTENCKGKEIIETRKKREHIYDDRGKSIY